MRQPSNKMANMKLKVLGSMLGVTCFLSYVSGLTFKEKVAQVKIDATWIDDKAHDVVDLVFVMDRSGSVSQQDFAKSKDFVKDFLEYFSIANQHTQVGIVLFSSGAATAIPLTYDNHKCKFMDQLAAVPITTGGATNANEGLGLALRMITAGRHNIGALPVVVFITDGDYNNGGNPIGQIQALKSKGALVIVITIGTGLSRKAEMLSWASLDNRKKPMAFPLDNFNLFAQLAHYIHKGGQESKFLPINKDQCGNRCVGSAQCMCDTLGTLGKPTCGCNSGNYVKVTGSTETCAQCTAGFYQEEKNVFKHCKSCPPGQVTLAPGSTDISQCSCATGFWNPQDRSRKPPCATVTCGRDSVKALDDRAVTLKGSCQYTYGQGCNYQCLRGYITGGVTTSICGQNGKMHPLPPRCTAPLCPILPTVSKGDGWKCIYNGRSQSGNYPYRTTCQNRCKPGFLPRPGTNAFIICGQDLTHKKGKWSGDGLVCDPRKCPVLPKVLNGQYNQRECSLLDSDRTFGKVCSVTCNPGFVISHDINWVCGDDGQWSNYEQTVTCRDIRPPEILSCPQHVQLNNVENQGYALVKLKPLDAFDNDKASSITQKMKVKFGDRSDAVEYPCGKTECGQSIFNFPIGTSTINITVADRSGNNGYCVFEITVKDIQAPQVVQCDGPDTKDGGFIYADSDEAVVTWKEPEFSDNSNDKLEIFQTGSPGQFKVGRRWNVIYTAKDTAGNTAKCEFSFKLTGIKCPPLHLPANGALVCDKLSFGIYCVPQCQRGLDRLLPDHLVRIPVDYFCSVKGEWRPHDEVGDCSIRTPITPQTSSKFEFTWFEGNCQDEATKQSIITNTINALASGGPSFVGVGFQDSHGRPLTHDDFEVFCGPKNESIIQLGGGGSRFRRDVEPWQSRLHKLSVNLN